MSTTLPEDFNVKSYQKYNPSLARLTEEKAVSHYLHKGREKGLIYKVELPSDFDVNGYRMLNPDISSFSDDWLEAHYTKHNKRENRLYRLDLPSDFLPDVYRELNPDLKQLTDIDLKIHYCLHGKQEKRLYADPLFDQEFFIKANDISDYIDYSSYVKDIRTVKSLKAQDYIKSFSELETNYVLVNHNSINSGSIHSLYTLYSFLRSNNKRCVILEPSINNKLIEFYNIQTEDLLIYHNDPYVLYWLCVKIKCERIIFNSINFAMGQVAKWLDRKKLILFSRETRNSYMLYSSLEPDIVLSSRIALSYSSSPLIQPPIISLDWFRKLDQDYSNPIEIPGLDSQKITIGMCGTTEKRKNPDLFAEVADILPQFNFLWIGGDNTFPKRDNIFHVKDTLEVGKYYQLLDYFVLFSQEEPFGKVVVESLYLNIPTLTFRDNIYYDFKQETLSGLYHEFAGHITKTNAASHILNVCKNKKQNFAKNPHLMHMFDHYTQQFLDKLN